MHGCVAGRAGVRKVVAGRRTSGAGVAVGGKQRVQSPSGTSGAVPAVRGAVAGLGARGSATGKWHVARGFLRFSLQQHRRGGSTLGS